MAHPSPAPPPEAPGVQSEESPAIAPSKGAGALGWLCSPRVALAALLGLCCGYVLALELIGVHSGLVAGFRGAILGALMLLTVNVAATAARLEPWWRLSRSRRARVAVRSAQGLRSDEHLQSLLAACERSGDEGAVRELEEAVLERLPYWRAQRLAYGGALAAVGVLILLRLVLFEPFYIPSDSMVPTLEIGDQVVVNRLAYGVRLPFAERARWSFRLPARGDVIVFREPRFRERDYIKRVVGLPGDELHLTDDALFVNGQPVARALQPSGIRYWNRLGDGRPWFLEDERLAYTEALDGRAYTVLQRKGKWPNRTEGPWVVPPGHVFVMGDNRDNSGDSRYAFGVPGFGATYVPAEEIKGKALLIWLSLAHGGWFDRLFGGSGLRVDRMLIPVSPAPAAE